MRVLSEAFDGQLLECSVLERERGQEDGILLRVTPTRDGEDLVFFHPFSIPWIVGTQHFTGLLVSFGCVGENTYELGICVVGPEGAGRYMAYAIMTELVGGRE